jgi:hypothetical protein
MYCCFVAASATDTNTEKMATHDTIYNYNQPVAVQQLN